MKQKDIVKKLRALADEIEEVETEETDETETETEETDEDAESEDSDEDSEEVNLPATAEEINDLDKEEVIKLCGQIGIETDGKKQSALKSLLITALQVLKDETDELEQDDVNALAAAVGVKKAKKMSQTIEALQEYFGEAGEKEVEEESEEEEDSDKEESEDEDEEESDDESEDEESEDEDEDSEDKDEDESEDEEESEDEDKEESEDEEESEEEEAAEEVDAEAVAAKAKLPKESTMQKHLDMFNKVAGKAKIDAKKAGGVKKAYRKLLERMVTGEGEVAEWGTPYVSSDSEVFCCGLEVKEIKIKGHKQACQCVVTNKKFAVDDENNFEEVE